MPAPRHSAVRSAVIGENIPHGISDGKFIGDVSPGVGVVFGECYGFRGAHVHHEVELSALSSAAALVVETAQVLTNVVDPQPGSHLNGITGGDLFLHETQDVVAAKVVPRSDQLTAISGQQLHSVEPMTAGARITVVTNFYHAALCTAS